MALDPRYHIMLTPSQERIAKLHLQNIWTRILQLSAENGDAPTTSSEESEESPTAMEEDDPFEAMLKTAERLRETAEAQSNHTVTVPQSGIKDITPFVENFLKTERIKTDDVVGWWEGRNLTHPELYILACVVLALPMTQISVERLFSFLKTSVTDRRARLSDVSVDNVMFVGCNQKYMKQ